MTEYGKQLILNGDVKYIGEGEDPAENPYMKAYARALKEVYQPKRSKREDPLTEIPRLANECMKKMQDECISDMGCGALNTMET